MKIGYACTPLTIENKTTRTLILKNFNEDTLTTLIDENLNDLLEILKYNKTQDIYLFRISSNIIPLGSHPINTFKWWVHFKHKLFKIGNYIKENNMRVSMHPGQYTVLNSPKKEIVNKSLKDLNYHCNFLDSLGLDYTHKIVLHIGGVYDDKKNSIDRFIKNFKLLSSSCKKRLVIENDERCFSLDDVLYISSIINIPVIFDNLHNKCNNTSSYSLKEILNKVSATWKLEDGTMKVHYSQQAFDKKLGSHSSTININEFLDYYNIAKNFKVDIMLEVKDKNLSSIKCLNTIKELYEDNLNLEKFSLEKEKYYFVIKSFNENYFLENEPILTYNKSFKILYDLVDFTLKHKPLVDDYISNSKTLWGFISHITNKRENMHFNNLIKEGNLIKIRDYIYKTTRKYTDLIDFKIYNSYFYYY